MKVDQDARNALIDEMRRMGSTDLSKLSQVQATLMKRVEAVDQENISWMKGTVSRFGWPGKTMVGHDGTNAAWLLVQHADRDRAFQKKCLALMEAVLEKNEISKMDFAYLTDRVLVADKKPQRYGTQIDMNKGAMKPYPMEDPPNVDKRRATVGLMPMAKYMELVREMYAGKK
jgi:hypothetical protein